MVNGTNLVWTYINRNTDIKRNLSRGIINIRSLAKYILESHPNIDITTTGIVTSIRRYLEENKFEEKNKNLSKIFSNTKMEMSFGNSILHVRKTEHTLASLNELFKKLNLLGTDNASMVMDKSSFALIYDNEQKNLIRSQFENNVVISEISDVGHITLKFDPLVIQTPNVFATVLNEIGINDINVLDSITKRERFMIFVHEKDLMETCNILYKFTRDGQGKLIHEIEV